MIKYIFIHILITYPINAVFSKSANSYANMRNINYQAEYINPKGQFFDPLSYLQNIAPMENSPPPHLNTDDQLDPNIKWDSKWADKMNFGQVSAVSIDRSGNVVIFHRGSRVWDDGTFDINNRFNKYLGPITQNTIVVLDKNGEIILEWGKDMFYLPHGLTIDSEGNYWITDVAMHQVFKFDAKDIEMHKEHLKNGQSSSMNNEKTYDTDDLFKNSIVKPSLILGQAFEPGNDDNHFCKPSAVAVHSNGDFFVSDGYCNTRIIKYNAKGEKILQWGRRWNKIGQQLTPNAFSVPHALALAEELNYIMVADREHGRILCFYSSNGEFHKEYKDPRIGTKVFSIAYARNKIYLVNGPDTFPYDFHVRGYVLDVGSGNITSQFGPNGDMNQPHDIAVTNDGKEIYVAELNLRKVYKFTQGSNNTKVANYNNSLLSYPELAPLSEPASNEALVLSFSVLIATVILITLCLIMAVVVARCRKRGFAGCPLKNRKSMDWDSDKNENFKLSNFLGKRVNRKFRFFEKRPNTRDFNKLSNEPETSDDDNCENNLTNII